MRSRMWIGLLIGFSVIAAACTQGERSMSTDEGPVTVGDAAPDFTLPSTTGGAVSMSDYIGKRVLLYFSMGPG
jgi:hypothetical protein